MGETYIQNPDCIISDEWDGDPVDYVCPDAGKIDLILVSANAKHIGNPQHEFEGLPDDEPLNCPCFTAEEANTIADGEVTYCSFHPSDTTWASLVGTDGSTGVQETIHTAANPDPYWQRCSFDAAGFTCLFLRNLTLDEVAACYAIITNLIAAKGLEPVSGSNVCQPFK